MKKIYILIFISLLSYPLLGQAVTYNSIFEKYSKTEGAKSSVMNSKMIKMIGERSNDAKLSKLLDGIKTISVLSVPVSDNKDFPLQINDYISARSFSNLMTSSESGKEDKFYFYDGGNKRSSLLMILNYDSCFYTIIRIIGYFDIKDISKLSQIAK